MSVSVDELVAQTYRELERGNGQAAVLWARILVGAFHDQQGLRLLAVSAHVAGDRERAASTYPRAREAFPAVVDLMSGFGELCLQRAQYDEAARWLRASIEADPEARHPAGSRARLLVAKHKRKFGL